MWDAVIVDKGSKREGERATGSAFRIPLEEPTTGGFEVSRHAWSYWVRRVFFCDMGMTVFRDTDTGRTITAMIADKKSGDEIHEFLLPVFLSQVEPLKLQNAVRNAITYAHFEGRREKAAEIRAALKAD